MGPESAKRRYNAGPQGQTLMVVYNAATRELTAKIVYYGPGLGGKTTNLHLLHDRLDPQTVGKLLNLATQTDRTIYFDLLPVELGDIKGYKIRFQLATVPGQTAFNETRRVVLRGADGIVFVADSQWSNLPKNLESWQNLKENLKSNAVSFEGIPVVIQYNKRDLPDILSVDALQEALGLSSYPFVEAVASAGRGVTETFKLISKLTFVDLLRRLQGRKPEDTAAASRKDQDDLLSWKESMLNREQPSMAPARPRMALVPPAPDEPPFEAAELARLDDEVEIEGPLNETVRMQLPGATPPALAAASQNTGETTEIPAVSDTFAAPAAAEAPAAPPAAGLEERISQLEARLSEALSLSAGGRLEAIESQAQEISRKLGEDRTAMDSRLARLEAAPKEEPASAVRVQTLEDRIATEAKRQRTAEDDVAMALRNLAERGEKLHQLLDGFATQTQDFALTITTLATRVSVLETGLSEKTNQTRREADDIRSQIESLQGAINDKLSQGRREAEDIRAQIAPLLEAEKSRSASAQAVPAEVDRLRESLADSLTDLSERLRRAVRG
jgi:signal recognition particle receptor subunit beta